MGVAWSDMVRWDWMTFSVSCAFVAIVSCPVASPAFGVTRPDGGNQSRTIVPMVRARRGNRIYAWRTNNVNAGRND